MNNKSRIINGTSVLVQVAPIDKGFNSPKVKTLLPGEASLIDTADPAKYLVRDAHSQQLLPIRQPSNLTESLLISDQSLKAQKNGAAVKIEIKNTTKSAIEICQLDETTLMGAQINSSVARLAPNESATIDAKSQEIYGARIHTSGSFFQTFIAGHQPNQKIKIALLSRSSDVSSTISVVNESYLTLALQWIDFDGTMRRTTKLEPGKSTKQDTFLSHPWILKDLHSGIIVDACVGSHENKTWVFKSNKLRSIGNTKSTVVEFWNAASYPVQLLKNDFTGKKTRIDIMLPGARRIQPTQAGCVWEMRKNSNFELLQVFIPSPRNQQLCRIIPRDEKFQLPPNITFENNSGLTIDLAAKDSEGVERIFASLPHRSIHSQPTTTAAKWLIKDQMSGQVLEELVTTQEEFKHIITAKGIHSGAMDVAVKASFINTTPFYVDVSWIDYDGAEEHYHRLKPGEQFEQETHATHVWRFRERETGDILHLFIASEEANQKVEIVMRPLHSREKAIIRFRNYTGLTVEVLWFDKEGKHKVLRTLIPGRKAAFKTFASHAWALRDKASGTVLQTTIAKAGDQKVELNNSMIRSKRSDRGAKLIFKNNMPFKVDIHWIDYEGAETAHETLRSGETLEKNSYTTHPYRFRHHITKKEVGVFLPTEAARQKVNMSLRAYETRTKTTVEVRNITSLNVSIFKVDTEGNEHFQFDLKPRDGKTISTFSTHPIIVKDKLSKEPVAFTIAGDRPQLLEVNGDLLRSNRTEYPVWITWENVLKLPVDIFWVKYDGSEELKRSLQPGESFKMSTYPSHVWRAKFQMAGTEVDLYIAGEKDQQKRKIGAVPALRTKEREGGLLWPGEVALYEDINFEGRVWIAHGDLPDFSILSGFDNTVSSVRVAQNTAVSVFEDSYFNALPQDMNLMAKEVRAAVEETFKSRLSAFQKVVNKSLTKMKAGKDEAFVKEVNNIQRILDNAANSSPTQVGVVIERFVNGTKLRDGEKLLTISLEHGGETLEGELKSILAKRPSSKDREVFATAVRAAILDIQEVIFDAFTAVWDTTLVEGIKDGARSALDNLGTTLEKTAEQSALKSNVLVQKQESDVFHVDVPDLAVKDIGEDAMSSIRILRNIAPEKLRISSTNKVVDDPQMVNGKLVRKPTYRTTISFPFEVKEIQLWGTEETTVTVGGVAYEVGPKDDQFARLKPKLGGTLILQVAPDRIGVSPLMMRTNSMSASERVFIFPDADVHRKLVKLGDKAFVEGVPDEQEEGGIRKLKAKENAKEQELIGAQQAIQTLSKTAAAATTVSATGSSKDRKLITSRMDMSAFQLDFGGAGNQASDQSFKPMDPAIIYAEAEGAELLEQGLFDVLEDIGDAVVSVGVAIVDTVEDVVEEAAEFIEDTANAIAEGFEDLGEALEKGFEEIGDAFEAAGEWIEGAIEDGLEFMEDAIEEASEFLEDMGSAIADAANAVAEGISKGLQIVVKAAGRVVTVIVDTIEKVGEVVMYIVEKVVEVVESVIDFICSLFAWGDILDTQQWIMGLVDKGFVHADNAVEMLQGMLEKFFETADDKVSEFMSNARKHLGVEDPVENENGPDTSDAMDGLMWLLDKISIIAGGAMSLREKVMDEVDIPTVKLGEDVVISDGLESKLQEATTILFESLIDIADDGVDAVMDVFNSVIQRIKNAIAEPDRAAQLLVAIFIDIGEVFLKTGISMIANVSDAILKLFRILLEVIKITIDTRIEIPFITELYEFIAGGERLTIKSLFCLLIAIPVTILSKLFLGNERFKKMKLSQQVGGDDGLGLYITYGFSHILLAFLGGLSDLGFKANKFNKVDGPVVLSGGILVFSLLAIGTSFPYYNNEEGSSPSADEFAINFFCWAMQVYELIPFVAGVGAMGNMKRLRPSKGKHSPKTMKKWEGAKSQGQKFEKYLSILTSGLGIVHLLLNSINLATVGIKSEYDQFKDADEAGHATRSMGFAYVATTIPVILEAGLNVKDLRVKGAIIAARSVFHVVEAGSVFVWAGVRNGAAAKT